MQQLSFFGRALVVLFPLVAAIPQPSVSAASPLPNLFGRSADKSGNSVVLTEKNGRWMIFAGSFAGPGAEQDAQELVAELRTRYRLPAYIHKQHYDYTKRVRGKGLNPYGGPKMMSYRQKGAFDEIAVLVGNFATVNDPALQKTLSQIKYARPNCLTLTNEDPTTLRFAGLRALQKRLNNDTAKKSKGPLGQAFVSRNPLLPDEFFVRKGIEPFVERMNRGVKFSLLDCPGKYTLRVATFRGNVILDQKKVKEVQETGKMESRLADAADKAHKLTMLLRERRVEAYEFHDRYESTVTVGSFNSTGLPRNDGRIEIHPMIQRLIQSYSPQKNPSGKGLLPRSLGGIPFDVQPTIIEVPKTSVANGLAVRGGSVR